MYSTFEKIYFSPACHTPIWETILNSPGRPSGGLRKYYKFREGINVIHTYANSKRKYTGC